uniref:Uncharacterized protein n=1 Tax=Romanomermis culicivorax TaxID=13658 RepID=A0A915LCV9_ROMCU
MKALKEYGKVGGKALEEEKNMKKLTRKKKQNRESRALIIITPSSSTIKEWDNESTRQCSCEQGV